MIQFSGHFTKYLGVSQQKSLDDLTLYMFHKYFYPRRVFLVKTYSLM